MDDADFDRAAIAAVLEQAALRGWADVSLVEAGQDAGLDLSRLRRRVPNRLAVLMRLGAELDGAALSGVGAGTPRERLFDIVMNRFEALQRHRDGVRAVLTALPAEPATAAAMYAATLRSAKWMLEGAGVPATGIAGALRVHGLVALWLYALRAWERDDSADLSATMAAVDRGLDRALQAERSLPGRAPDPEPLLDPTPEPDPEPEPVPPPVPSPAGDLPEPPPSLA